MRFPGLNRELDEEVGDHPVILPTHWIRQTMPDTTYTLMEGGKKIKLQASSYLLFPFLKEIFLYLDQL
jgi:hypothetical protein